MISILNSGSMVKNLPVVLEKWVPSLGQEDPSQEEMATHSGTLDWEIPWTEEAGRLQSTGSQRVRRDLATKQKQLYQYFQWFADEDWIQRGRIGSYCIMQDEMR